MKRTSMTRRKKKVPAAARAYWDSLPDECVVTGKSGTVLHHILSDAPGKKGRRDHMLVVKLDPFLHNMGRNSVHMIGSEAKFNSIWDTDIVAIAVRNRDEWIARNA